MYNISIYVQNSLLKMVVTKRLAKPLQPINYKVVRRFEHTTRLLKATLLVAVLKGCRVHLRQPRARARPPRRAGARNSSLKL